MPDIQLWVDYKPFCFGTIQAHPKLSKPYLDKVLSYARSKGGDGGYPRLRWGVWKHMALNKMLLHESYTSAYFEAYRSVKDTSREERLEEAECLQQSYEEGDLEGYRNALEVDTMEFVLLLYLQQASKVSLRTSLLGEEWPGSSPRCMSPSPDLDTSKTAAFPNVFDEGYQLSYVLTNLTEILELLSEPSARNGQHKSERRLSLDAVKSLGFIIKACNPKLKTIVPLHTLASRHRFQNKSGFSKTSNDFSCRTFENWLRGSLGQSPFGLSESVASGTKLKWTMPKRSKRSASKRAQIVSNKELEVSGGDRLVYFSCCSNQTIARQSPVLDGSYVKISKCNHSHFYLLSPLRFVTIEKCEESTFVFGPVASCIRVIGCHNVTVIAPCRSIIIGSSRNITTHVATSTKPLLIGETSQSHHLGAGEDPPLVTLGPYHTFYGQLEQHLAKVGLVISPQMNQWNNPALLTTAAQPKGKADSRRQRRTDGSADTTANASSKQSRLLPPSEFFSFAIPFDSPDSSSDFEPTTSIPWPLPKEYLRGLDQKKQALSQYKSAVRGAELTSDEKKAFQVIVEKNFKEWLEATGNKRQLDDLADLTKFFAE